VHSLPCVGLFSAGLVSQPLADGAADSDGPGDNELWRDQGRDGVRAGSNSGRGEVPAEEGVRDGDYRCCFLHSVLSGHDDRAADQVLEGEEEGPRGTDHERKAQQ